MAPRFLTVAVTMPNRVNTRLQARRFWIPKILGKFYFLPFEENSHRIRGELAQKRRFIANDSFKPVWYGLVQRRWESRQG
jgi:hypothetical protein